MSSVLSHLLPYALYVAPPAVSDWLPPSWRPWVDPFRVVVAGAALVLHARRGAYPELRPGPSPHRGATLLAIGAGLAVALVWMPLAALVPSLGARGGFSPEAAGAAAAPWLLAARIAGFVVVIPLAEELFVRSLLPRWVDAPEGWAARGIGTFTPLSAALSIAFFAGTHPEWLAALVTGLLWSGLLARTRRLGDAVIAHALANALLAGIWIGMGDRGWW